MPVRLRERGQAGQITMKAAGSSCTKKSNTGLEPGSRTHYVHTTIENAAERQQSMSDDSGVSDLVSGRFWQLSINAAEG
jgi:hypothetical protein